MLAGPGAGGRLDMVAVVDANVASQAEVGRVLMAKVESAGEDGAGRVGRVTSSSRRSATTMLGSRAVVSNE